MRHPLVYSPHEIRQWTTDEMVKPGVWRPARPCGFWELRRHWRMHLRIVWWVLIGKCDVLNWEADCQGGKNERSGRGWFLPEERVNDLQRDTIQATIAHAKRGRWTNAFVRKDGVETKYEADWIKHMERRA